MFQLLTHYLNFIQWRACNFNGVFKTFVISAVTQQIISGYYFPSVKNNSQLLHSLPLALAIKLQSLSLWSRAGLGSKSNTGLPLA